MEKAKKGRTKVDGVPPLGLCRIAFNSSLLSAALTCWVANGGYTTIYFEWGQNGYLWEFLSLPLIFLAQVCTYYFWLSAGSPISPHVRP